MTFLAESLSLMRYFGESEIEMISVMFKKSFVMFVTKLLSTML